jgi:N-acetylneuraminic acid mutarotase
MKKVLPLIPLYFVLFLYSCSKSSSTSTSTTGTGTGGSTSPVITQFSPSAAKVDSIVTITGTNFSTNRAEDVVAFNDTLAVVKSATATQLMVVVPLGASTGKITVTVNSQTATSAQNFIVSDQWSLVTNFPGTMMAYVISFNIGDNLYVGIGEGQSGSWLSEFWTYNTDAGSWTQKAGFPGDPGGGGVGFAVAGKGYVIHPDSTGVKWLWEYDTVANGWNRLSNSNFPGLLGGGLVFVVNNKAYAGLGFGYSGNNNNIWEFDPATGTWTQKQNFPGMATNAAASFVIGNYAYVGTGLTGPATSLVSAEFWHYDASNDSWTQKGDFPGVARSGAPGIGINGKGYLGQGESATGGDLSDWWQYDPSTDSWTQKKDFPANGRLLPADFAGANNVGYLGFGSGPEHQIQPNVYSNIYIDLWQYQP